MFMDCNLPTEFEEAPYQPPRRRFGSPPATFSFDPSVTQKSPYVGPVNSNMIVGIRMFQIFAKMHRRQLVMESFMKIKLVYGISKLQRKRQDSSFASKESSIIPSQSSKRRREKTSKESLDDSGGSLNTSASRAQLLNELMSRLQENSKDKHEAERRSVEMKRWAVEDKVVQKLNSLEKMIEELKSNQQISHESKPYATIRAKAKGQPSKNSPTRSIKPKTTETLRKHTEPYKTGRDEVVVQQFQTNRFASPSSPIEQQYETSEASIPRTSARVNEADEDQRDKTRLTQELHALTTELNDLRRINESYIKKNSVLLKVQEPQSSYAEDSKWLRTEQSTDSRIESLKHSYNNNHPQVPYLAVPQQSYPAYSNSQREVYNPHQYGPVNPQPIFTAFRRGNCGDASVEKPTSTLSSIKPYTALSINQSHSYAQIPPPQFQSGYNHQQPSQLQVRRPMIFYQTRGSSRDNSRGSKPIHRLVREPSRNHLHTRSRTTLYPPDVVQRPAGLGSSPSRYF